MPKRVHADSIRKYQVNIFPIERNALIEIILLHTFYTLVANVIHAW